MLLGSQNCWHHSELTLDHDAETVATLQVDSDKIRTTSQDSQRSRCAYDRRTRLRLPDARDPCVVDSLKFNAIATSAHCLGLLACSAPLHQKVTPSLML